MEAETVQLVLLSQEKQRLSVADQGLPGWPGDTIKFPRGRVRVKRYRRHMPWEHRARAPNLAFGHQDRFPGGGIFKAEISRAHRTKTGIKGCGQLQKTLESFWERYRPEEEDSRPRGEMGPEKNEVLTLLSMVRRFRTGDWRVTEKEEVWASTDCVTVLPPLASCSVSLGKSLSLLRASVFLYKTGFTIHTNGKVF